METPVLKTSAKSKIFYVDNLRILLIILVILHHAVITYGASGSWYYSEKTSLMPALIIMNLFVATNQAFFMGFFFFLSSFFIEPALDRKGREKFIIDRLKRLGIPLIFYSIVLSPSLNYIAEHYGKGEHHSFIEYMSGYRHWIDFGVLWFVAALLIFSLFYVLLKTKSSSFAVKKYPFPGDYIIFIFSVTLGFISYLVRGYFPIGWTLRPLGFQLGHFPQYIILFIAGIVTYHNKWLEEITYKKSKRWISLAFIFIIVVFPLMYTIKIQTKSADETVLGHFTWQSLLYAEWEQITGISLIVGLLGIAKQKWNNRTSFKSALARATYGAYIFHPLVLITLSLLVQGIPIEPLFKLLFVAPLAVVCSFSLSSLLLLKIPNVNNVI